MNKKVEAIIKSILIDIKSGDPAIVKQAAATLDNRVVVDLLILAGCPAYMIEAMKETAPLSLLERRHCSGQILSKLKSLVKKIPA